MDELKADTDTQTEVDLLMFDYLLSTAIYEALCPGRNENQGSLKKHDPTGLNDTVQIFMSLLPPPETFPSDLRIKVQLFKIASMINNTQAEPSPSTVTQAANTLISTCDATERKGLKAHAADLAVQLRRNEPKQEALLRPLINIMELLSPPILAQLERGKVDGLIRAETQQLKERIGFVP